MTPFPSPALLTPRRRLFWLGLVLTVALAAFAWTRFSSSGGGRDVKPSAVPVRAAPVLREDVPLLLSALGTVQPSGSVLVRSRVDGRLMRIHFMEGQRVGAGDLLAEIDPRPFRNALREAQGQLARDAAQLENARRDLARYEQLSKGDYIAEQQVETQRALVRQYEGVVRSDEAQAASAALQLEYSRIEAPMDGRLGLRQVDEGNMIRASDAGGIVRITRTEPADVVFSLPETELPEVLAAYREAAARGRSLSVRAFDRNQKIPLADGELLSMDNQVDTATGTVKFKARFANSDEALFPNQFVNIRLEVRIRKDATVAPAAAVQLGAQGSFVYVLREGKAHLRLVKTGWRSNDKVVVESGLEPGETVVVDGVDRLRDGAAATAGS